MNDQEFLKSKLSYDTQTGVFTALHSHGKRKSGAAVGSLTPHGYLVVHFKGKSHMCHRLAFLYVTGEWPLEIVDHKDGDKTNNKWNNLRLTTVSINSRNRRTNKNNKSGTMGVSWHSRDELWQANITVDGKQVNLGLFQHKEDAIFARMTAEKDYGYWLDKLCEED